MLEIVLVCIVLCLIHFVVNKEITLFEFTCSSVISIIVALILFGIMLIPVPNDAYYQSGKIIKVGYFPPFVEEYEQEHVSSYPCGTDSKGNTRYCTRVWYTTEHARHMEHWDAFDSLGQDVTISSAFYQQVKRDFGNGNYRVNTGRSHRCTHGGHRVRGDNSSYYTNNVSNTYKYPTTQLARWYNPIKKSKSIFNTEKATHEYPIQQDWRNNNRLMCGNFRLAWNIFNTKVYEAVGANVILISSDENLKDYWMRGKKNDIVIQVDNPTNPNKVNVFGWYDTERLSLELETYILANGISEKNLDEIRTLIVKYYVPFDFSKFDYLKFKLADWQLILIAIVTFIVMCVTNVIFATNDDRRD